MNDGYMRWLPRRFSLTAVLAVAVLALWAGLDPRPAAAIDVATEAQLRAAFEDPATTEIAFTADISLTCTAGGDLNRPSAGSALTVFGNGHVLRQDCFGERVIENLDSGLLTIDGLTIANGSSFANGGGIYNGASLILVNSLVIGNDANVGGGIYNDGNLSMINSTVTGSKQHCKL
jgi:hypothetical protein